MILSDRAKKILFVVVFLILTSVFAYALYWFFFRATPPAEEEAPEESVTGVLPEAGYGTVQPSIFEQPGALPETPTIEGEAPGFGEEQTTATTEPSRTTALTRDLTQAISKAPGASGVRMYYPNDGKFYKVTGDGLVTPLSDKAFYDVQDVTWGKQTDKAILKYPDGSKILYDFNSEEQVTLPNHWDDFDFSPQDGQIVAKSLGNNESNRFLIVATPDGSSARAIAELGDNADKVFPTWSPNNQVVAYSMTGDAVGFDQQSILLVGQNQENFKSLEVEGRGFIPEWSPSGEKLLYSVYSSETGYAPMLWVSGATGDNVNAGRENLGLYTWADKCAWQSESVIICAVPEGLEIGAGLQRDIAGSTPDDIFKIDLSSGTKMKLGRPDGNPTIQQMVLSEDGNYVFYTDRATGQLMRYALNP